MARDCPEPRKEKEQEQKVIIPVKEPEQAPVEQNNEKKTGKNKPKAKNG